MTHKLFCFGYGYSCDFLGRALQDKDWQITGTTRDPQKRLLMKQQGLKALIFDQGKPLADPALFFKDVTHLLISVPPDDQGDPAFNAHAQDILNIPTLKWLGYISSTSVYGDRNGAEIDETAEPRPGSKRGSRRLKAEQQWMSLFHKHDLPVHIFRTAGIYGPSRSALDSVKAGNARRIDKPGHVFNRIHVEDIVNILIASMNNPQAGSIYNLSDDKPSPSHEVISYACEILDIPVPPLLKFDEADMAPIARSFYSDNKRISNRKIKEDLGVSLKYPDYKAGLLACLEHNEDAQELLPSI